MLTYADRFASVTAAHVAARRRRAGTLDVLHTSKKKNVLLACHAAYMSHAPPHSRALRFRAGGCSSI